MNLFRFTPLGNGKRNGPRIGVIETPHGSIETPAFVPVGTQGAVKSLTPDELNTLGVQLFFVNTYHTYLRPGLDVIHSIGGLHTFMGWNGPIITDSGGFQVFSLKPRISEEGVEFQSHWDGSKHMFTPESSMEYQAALMSDIHIAFDDCTPYPVTHNKAKRSMERTHRWAKRSLDAHKQGALYGVIQGSVYEDLRRESTSVISAMDFDGIAIGGVSVGECKTEMADVLRWVSPHLPPQKPRHVLGVGEIDDIFTLVSYGMDTFDCVQPTRLARMGMVYVRTRARTEYLIDVTKAMYAKDVSPLENGCTCYTCTHFSRGYIHHLFRVRELLGYRLTTIHNLHFVHTLVARIRQSIQEDTFLELQREWLYNTHR